MYLLVDMICDMDMQRYTVLKSWKQINIILIYWVFIFHEKQQLW